MSCQQNAQDFGAFFNNDRWKVVLDKACDSAVLDNLVSRRHKTMQHLSSSINPLCMHDRTRNFLHPISHMACQTTDGILPRMMPLVPCARSGRLKILWRKCKSTSPYGLYSILKTYADHSILCLISAYDKWEAILGWDRDKEKGKMGGGRSTLS